MSERLEIISPLLFKEGKECSDICMVQKGGRGVVRGDKEKEGRAVGAAWRETGEHQKRRAKS